MTRIVSSPAMVPSTSGSFARSMASASGCASPGAGAQHEQLLRLLDAGQVVDQRALQVVPGGVAAGADGLVVGRRLVGAVGGALHQAELLDVARQRGLGHVEALGEQALAQLFLAAHRIAATMSRMAAWRRAFMFMQRSVYQYAVAYFTKLPRNS